MKKERFLSKQAEADKRKLEIELEKQKLLDDLKLKEIEKEEYRKRVLHNNL